MNIHANGKITKIEKTKKMNIKRKKEKGEKKKRISRSTNRHRLKYRSPDRLTSKEKRGIKKSVTLIIFPSATAQKRFIIRQFPATIGTIKLSRCYPPTGARPSRLPAEPAPTLNRQSSLWNEGSSARPLQNRAPHRLKKMEARSLSLSPIQWPTQLTSCIFYYNLHTHTLNRHTTPKLRENEKSSIENN